MSNHESVSAMRSLRLQLPIAILSLALFGESSDAGTPPDLLLGYTELRTDLPDGRHANVTTMRAVVVKVDGTGKKVLGESLTREANAWTQFAGWSRDGKTAIIGRGWESLENARWEEEHKTFRFTPQGWLYDMYLLDLKGGEPTNLTAIDRVSIYNTGLFFWPDDPTKLGFQALVDGNSHPFKMDRNGKNKRDLTKDSKEFSYGFSASPDGKKIAYHKNYQVYVADADGTKPKHIQTNAGFNFNPQWSPNADWLLFLSGAHYDCHPYIVRKDGTGLRRLASRSGYRGVIEFLDVPDFHGGSSDVPVWAPDGKSIYYTAKVETNIELFRATLDGKSEQLTKSPSGSHQYHPQPSPDGNWLVFGARREGVRQLYLMQLSDKKETRITNLIKGHAAMWAHWQLSEPR